MIASFLLVIVRKKKKTNKDKSVFYCNVSQIHKILKKHEKNNKMNSLDVGYLRTYTRHQIKNDQPGSHDFWRFLRQF